MYQWISQYLTNRKTEVHVNGTCSRKKTSKGVHQRGVLVFINDIVRDMPRKVHGAINADNLVLCSCRNTFQLQTIDYSRCLTPWKLGQNGSLSKSTQGRPPTPSSAFQQRNRRPPCMSNGQTLLADDNPTYMGVTFDNKTEKAEAKAKV